MILIVDMNYNPLGIYEFVMPIVSIIEKFSQYEIIHYSKLKENIIHKAEKIILSGTPLKDNYYINQKKKFKWIRETDKPIMGICAGMQAIGLAFSIRLKKCQEIGMTKIITTKQNVLFSSQFNAYELHNYALSNSIKKEFEILAKSKKCIQAIKHKRKDIYGILFHPEVRNKKIIENFCLKI